MHKHISIFIFSLLSINICNAAENRPIRRPYPRSPLGDRSQEIPSMRPAAMESFFQYAREGNIEALQERVEQYDNFDEPLSCFTAIYHATVAGNLRSVKFLSSCGAHMTRLYPSQESIKNRRWEYGHAQKLTAEESLLDVAIQHDHRELALYLTQFIPLWLPNGRGELPICNALRYNRPNIAFALINSNGSYGEYLGAHELTMESETALSCARKKGYRDIVEVITVALAQSIAPMSTVSHKSTPCKAPRAVSKKSFVPSRWVVLPSLFVIAVGAVYLSKMSDNGPKRVFASLVSYPLSVLGTLPK